MRFGLDDGRRFLGGSSSSSSCDSDLDSDHDEANNSYISNHSISNHTDTHNHIVYHNHIDSHADRYRNNHSDNDINSYLNSSIGYNVNNDIRTDIYNEENTHNNDTKTRINIHSHALLPPPSWTATSLRFHALKPQPVPRPPPVPDDDDLADLVLSMQQTRIDKLEEDRVAWAARNEKLWAAVDAVLLREVEMNKIKLDEQNRRLLEQERERQLQKELEEEKVKRNQKEIEKETEKIKEKEAIERKEIEMKQKEEEHKLMLQKQFQADNTTKVQWTRWTDLMKTIKVSLPRAVEAQGPWCSQAKRKLNPKLGQLTPNLSNAKTITKSIDDVLKSAPSPEAYTFILNHLSKLLIKQAEAEVTAKLSTAYPLAKVALALIVMGHTELGEVLMARLVKKCCWVIPYYPTKGTYTDIEYRKILGQTDSSEIGPKYADRMSGIFAFYAAILQTVPRSSDLPIPDGQELLNTSVKSKIPEHFRLSGAWQWIAAMLKIPMTSFGPSALLMTTFLDIAGCSFILGYGKQAHKVLKLLLEHGCRQDVAQWDKETKATVGRLTIILDEWEKTGSLKQEVEQAWI